MTISKIDKIMNTVWVRKYMDAYMSERPNTISFISQDDTECSDHEDFDCVTTLHNKAQYEEFKLFFTDVIQKFRPDIRAGCVLLYEVRVQKVI